MMALISIRKGRSLKTTFSILPCQLASGYVLHRRFRMGNWTLRRKKNLFLQYLEVPLAVRAAANDDSLSNRYDGSRACSRSVKLHDLWLTSPSSCPSRELCDQCPALNLLFLKFIKQPLFSQLDTDKYRRRNKSEVFSSKQRSSI